MKKFLTVLLALSVVFTYSFSSVGAVFAASTSETEFGVLVEQAASQVKANSSTYYTEAVKILPDKEPTGLGSTVEDDFWKASASIYQLKLDKLIKDKADDIKAIYTGHETDANALELADVVKLFAVANGSEYITGVNASKEAVPASAADMVTAIQADADVELAVSKAFAKDKVDKAVLALKSIDTSVYSTTVNKETNMTSVEMANALINKAITDINKLSFDKNAVADVKAELDKLGDFGTATLDAVTGKVTNENAAQSGMLTDFLKATDTTYNTEKYVIKSDAKYDNESLVTKDDEETGSATLAATKAEYLAAVAQKYAAYIKANNDAEGKKIADAYQAGVSEIINAAKTLKELTDIFAAVSNIPNVDANYVTDKAAIEELVVFANKYIAEGNDSEAIDKIVADAKIAAYKDAAAWTGLDAAKNAIEAAVKAQFDTKKIDELVANLEMALEDLLEEEGDTGYYAPEAEKVTALYNSIIAEAKACISDKELDKVKSKYGVTATYNNPTGLSEINNKGAVKSKIKAVLIGDKGWNSNSGQVQAYGVSLNASISDSAQRDFVGAGMFTNDTTIDQDWLADFYAEKGARTTDEAYALIPQAKAALDAVQTKAVVAAAVAALEAQIAALPEATKITASDAAAVEAVKEAAIKLIDETGAKLSATATTTLENAVTAAYNATKLALLKEINAYKVSDITAADKAALETLLKKVDDLNKKTESGEVYEGKAAITAVEKKIVTDGLAKIRTEALDAVKKAIAALPVTVTEDNVSLVDTAQKLYNEYVDTYTDFYNTITDVYGSGTSFNQNAANDLDATKTKELNDAIKAADKVKAEIAEKEKQEKISATEGLKISVSTKLYKNSKIRVNWKIKGGDASYIDGYQVWKSKKAQSGYSYMGKTKKLYMDNKKGLKQTKKGTRMYYKVRAFVEIDGQKYYSDWSNKGNRIWR